MAALLILFPELPKPFKHLPWSHCWRRCLSRSSRCLANTPSHKSIPTTLRSHPAASCVSRVNCISYLPPARVRDGKRLDDLVELSLTTSERLRLFRSRRQRPRLRRREKRSPILQRRLLAGGRRRDFNQPYRLGDATRAQRRRRVGSLNQTRARLVRSCRTCFPACFLSLRLCLTIATGKESSRSRSLSRYRDRQGVCSGSADS
jgi:hypothetical protein